MTRINAAVVIVCLCTALIIGPVGAVPSEPTGPAELSEQRPANTINATSIDQELGDVVSVPLNVSPGTRGVLILSGRAYETRTTFADTDDDGAVIIEVNTFKERGPFLERGGYSARGTDQVLQVERHIRGPLRTGEYSARLLSAPRTVTTDIELVEPQFQNATLQAAPRATPQSTSGFVETLSTSRSEVPSINTVVATFHAEGIWGSGRFATPPGQNLIVADNSTPGNTTTHTLQYSPSNRSVNFSRVQISYRAGDGRAPSGLLTAPIQHAGVDTDADGQLEREFNFTDWTVTRGSAGVLTFISTEDHILNESDTLLIQYDNVTNPTYSGADRARLALDLHQVPGVVEYGPTARGVFGNGVDVSVRSSSAGLFVSPMPFEYVAQPDEETLYILLRPDNLAAVPGDSVSVSLTNAQAQSPATPTQRLTVEGNLTTPTVLLTVPPRWTPTPSQNVTGATNLAPGTVLTVGLLSGGPVEPQLSRTQTIVQRDGTFAASFNTTAYRSGSLQVTVMSGSQRLAAETVELDRNGSVRGGPS